ncbi:MAG: hypothetical protein GWO02_09685, partial [Gammaproteobacteria bacterium]|nr:hypothetical protein [Gammaproteobacteria bacterium]
TNCGDCGNACAGGEVCSFGTCQTDCGAFQTNCDGVCTNTDFDEMNCGSCGNECAAEENCFRGTCRMMGGPGPGA